MAIDISRFIPRYVEEARGHIQQLEDGVAALESEPNSTETINQLFRSAHTIKGSSRILKLLVISETAHQLEDVLGALQKGQISCSIELTNLLYESVDEIARLVDRVEQSQTLPSIDLELSERLKLAAQGADIAQAIKSMEASSVTMQKHPELQDQEDVQSNMNQGIEQKNDPVSLKNSDTIRIKRSKLDDLIQLMGEVVSGHALIQQRLDDLKQVSLNIQSESTLEEIALNLKQIRRQMRDDTSFQQLLIEELHDTALTMRMLPLSIVFEPAARLIRDMARSIEKNVECNIQGGEIELDRQIIDKLSEPLIHLLRNAIDHGIETPQQRLEAGKSKFGQIKLVARQDGNWVEITIDDDGSGLALEKIRSKILCNGHYSAEATQAFSDKELIELIFEPGFSTKNSVTELSGRGVGMDVVKKIIVEDLHGEIQVETGTKGTCFRLRMPFTLAMMRILLCRAGGMPFAFTAQYVETILRVQPNHIMKVTERLVVVISNEFIPLIALSDLVGLTGTNFAKETKAEYSDGELLLIVLKTNNEKLAIIVDDLLDELDMVVKPLPTHMQVFPLVNGMVMTGENELVSVLNVPQIMQRSKSVYYTSSSSVLEKSQSSRQICYENKPNAHILVIDDSLNTREIEKDVLESFGYKVTTAEDGIDAWNKANGEHFDAILTDVEMPGMDGFALTQRLRQDNKFKHIPIIIVTSREKSQDKSRGMEVGADAYIVKGDFEQSNLLETLQNLLA